MYNLSGIKKVEEILSINETEISTVKGGRKKDYILEKSRKYIIPGYQREIRWSEENVQTLIDDLKEGSKFLGTITFSTSESGEFEVIDGQQRITVITVIKKYLEEYDRKNIKLCDIKNLSFPYFVEALKYKFDYEKIQTENVELYNNIIKTDVLEQRENFERIWKSIDERISSLDDTDKEKLLLALYESDLNVIINETEGTDSQRKFCVDYFIDINNKSVELDSLDIIRAYAFKENFSESTKLWIDIQKKCNDIKNRVKYSREELYYHYFLCKVNKEIDFQITRLGNDYTIKENINVKGKAYNNGTYIWNIIKNEKYYYRLLTDLNYYLDFINDVISSGTGSSESFKKYFKNEDGGYVDSTRLTNAYTMIRSILENDDVVPKMMIMKYFFEVLAPEKVNNKDYKIISQINIIATIFSLSTKGKSSATIAKKILQENWKEGLSEYAVNLYKNLPKNIGFNKLIKHNNNYTTYTGLYAAKRYFSMKDSCPKDSKSISGTVKVNEEIFKQENSSNGSNSIEHFMVNQSYGYAIYQDDGKTIDVEIQAPAKCKQYISTIANYLLMNKSINEQLKNRPVFEKINIIEQESREKKLEEIIPSYECRKQYYVIKKILHDESKYPQKKLEEAKNKKEKKKILSSYYKDYFLDEYNDMASILNSEEKVFEIEMDYILKNLSFERNDAYYEIETESIFSNLQLEVDEKNKKLIASVELYNPFYGEKNGDDEYEKMLHFAIDQFKKKITEKVRLTSSNEYGGSDDESIEFACDIESNEESIKQFIDAINSIDY